MFEEKEMPYAAKAFMELYPQPNSPTKPTVPSKEGTFPCSGRQTKTAEFGFYMFSLQPFPELDEPYKENK